MDKAEGIFFPVNSYVILRTKSLRTVSFNQAAKKFAASQSYGLDKSNFHFFEKTFDLVTGLAVDLTGWMPWLWDTSAELVTKWGFDRGGGDMATSLVFVGLVLVFQVTCGTTDHPWAEYPPI